jgi:hypothetical protein
VANAVHEKGLASIQPAGTGAVATTFGRGRGLALAAAAGDALAAAVGSALAAAAALADVAAAAGVALASAPGDTFATSSELPGWRGAPPSLGRRGWVEGPQSTAISKRKHENRTEP